MNTSKLFPDISLKHFIIIEFTMLLPCALAARLLWYYGLPMITLILYLFVCCLAVPLLYIKQFAFIKPSIFFRFVSGIISKQTTHLGATFSNLYLTRQEQLKWGLLGFLLSGGITFAVLYYTLTYMKLWQIQHVHLLYYPNTEVIVVKNIQNIYKHASQFSLLLVFIHPFAEEFYWREFVQSAMTGSMTYQICPEPVNWWVAVHYALYYIFVLANFVKQEVNQLLILFQDIFIWRSFVQFLSFWWRENLL